MAEPMKFDVQAEMEKAWDTCWEILCTPGIDEYGATYPPRQQWLTATDLERRLRANHVEVHEGLDYGSLGLDSWGHTPLKFHLNYKPGYRLIDVVRDWLACQVEAGVLVAHNFGRGHCSKMRFRPSGVPLTDAEKKTLAAKQRRLTKGAP